MYAAFADRERAHANVLFQHVTVAEHDVLTMKLLLGDTYTTENRILEQQHAHKNTHYTNSKIKLLQSNYILSHKDTNTAESLIISLNSVKIMLDNTEYH